MVTMPKSERSSLLNSIGVPIIQASLINQIQLEAKRASDVDVAGAQQSTAGSKIVSPKESENCVVDLDEEEEEEDASTPNSDTTTTCKNLFHNFFLLIE